MRHLLRTTSRLLRPRIVSFPKYPVCSSLTCQRSLSSIDESDYAAMKFRETLSSDEAIVFDVSSEVFERFVSPTMFSEGCYRLSFLTTCLLDDMFGITVEPVVGYCCDGEDDLMFSHAWVEMNGKKIDLSLLYNAPHLKIKPGEVLILDHVLMRGVKHTYHRERTPEAIEYINAAMEDPDMKERIEKQITLHRNMVEISRSLPLMRIYLDNCTDGITYLKLRQRILQI